MVGVAFYYYHNWVANRENMIHKNDCSFCNNGLGMKSKAIKGLNVDWVGPYDTKELAIAWVAKYSHKELPVKFHKCVPIIN